MHPHTQKGKEGEGEPSTSGTRRRPGPLSSKRAGSPGRAGTDADDNELHGIRLDCYVNLRSSALSPPPAGGTVRDVIADWAEGSSSAATIGVGSEVESASMSAQDSGASGKSHRSASGATKRGKSSSRSSKRRKVVAVRNRPPARGLGRPVVTGEGVELAARREARRELEDLKRQIREYKAILEGNYNPREYPAARKKREEELREMVPNLPSSDLVARLLETAQGIDNVAASSRNLKGSFVEVLRDGALFVQMAADALYTRANAAQGERLEEENKALRRELELLRKERESAQGNTQPQKGKGKAPAQKGGKETGARVATPATPTPGPSTAIEQPWTEVLGRKAKQAATKAAKAATGTRQAPPQKPIGKGQQGGGTGKKAPKRRVPRTSAVALTCPQGQYAKVVAEVRARVDIGALGIGGRINTRQAATGATIFEVSGEGHSDKADQLATKIREAIQGKEGVRVDRPVKTGEVRVRGLELSIRTEEVVAAVSAGAQCDPLCVQHKGIQQADRGAGSMWLRLPLAAAKKVAQTGHLMVGWSRAKVDLLKVRPMRCFKCLEGGHTRGNCPSEVDRSGRCYQCAGTGHTSRDCRAPQKCPLCVDLGRPAGHTLGAKQCSQRKIKGGGGTWPAAGVANRGFPGGRTVEAYRRDGGGGGEERRAGGGTAPPHAAPHPL
ncbi:PREDICTED: uncharacterized protein LOC105556772 [Vollenhovia emeryi]|uniref:uncharacterized protein LOC105556772 n=1 Tax=Vollenhovia emeryi TaxID=411798 RepID=UPI0005F3B666|nr:PREDICTED: uncharacterized protein LOC105556772 [Vollenhovia emeryi]